MELGNLASAHGINGIAYCAKGDDESSGVFACRVRRGIVRTTQIVIPQVVVKSNIPGQHHRFVFTDDKETVYLFTPSQFRRRIGRLAFDYACVSDDARFLAIYFHRKTSGYRVYDLRTNHLVWEKPGVALPIWSVRENHLIYLNLLGGYRYELFDVNFGTRRVPFSQKISMMEAVHLTGGWYPTYVRRCFNQGRSVLETPLPNQLLKSPDGQAAIATMSSYRHIETVNSEGTIQPPSPPYGYNDDETSIYHINAMGHIRRFAESVLLPVCWSEDGKHIYGNPVDLDWIQQDYVPRMYRMSLVTGRVAVVRLPKGTYKLLTFIEE